VPVREVPQGARRLREGAPVMIDERPFIETADAELHSLADQAWAALTQANDPPHLFVRGGALVYVGEGDDEQAAIHQHTLATLSDLMSRVAGWRKTTLKGVTVVFPPERVAKILLEWDPATYVGAPHLERIVTVPFFAAPAGKSVWDIDPDLDEPDHQVRLVQTPGYDADSRVWMEPEPELEGLVVTGSDDDTEEAKHVVNKLLADFPFVPPASAAHSISLMLLPFVRELIDGDTPLYLVTAPTPASGKGLLTDALLIPSQGYIPRISASGDTDEWRKKITSKLMQGPSVIMFDNLREGMTLDSPEIAGVLTCGGWWEDRILGVSKMTKLRVRNVWVATGNNIEVSKENGRRVCRIVLDSGLERPEERHDFKITNLHAYVREHRREIVWAALTIIQSWLNGHTVEDDVYRPWLTEGGVRKASFDSWSRVMGGLLNHIKVEGFLTDKIESQSDNELGTFLEALQAETVAGPLTAKEVASRCVFGQMLNPVLPTDLLGLTPPQIEKKMGYWLGAHKNRVADGRKLIRHDGRIAKWTVVSTDAPQ
jgi:hypothetical protein